MHANAPKICEPCLERFVSRIEMHRSDEHTSTFCWCPHHATMAMCIVEGGEIRSWVMECPLNEEDARAYRDRMKGLGLTLWDTSEERLN